MESEEEFESAESETELTDKEISNKFPSQIGEQTKIPSTTCQQTSNNHTQQHEQLSEEIIVPDSLLPQSSLQIREDTEPIVSDKDKNIAKETLINDKQVKDIGSEDQQEQTQPVQSGWGWGWGSIGSILTSSVTAVSDSAQSISKGIGSMVVNVEGALGVPQPVEMVREVRELSQEEEQERTKNAAMDDTSPVEIKDTDENKPIEETETPLSTGSGITGFFSGITAAVQTTGMDLMTGGLDALEAIGRKTVDIISDGDPGLRNKRAMLAGKDNTLSQLLREAKEQAEDAREMRNEEGDQTEYALNYSILFDQYDGLVHLEALELLSKECSNKVRTSLATYSGQELDDCNRSVEEIEKYFQEESEEEKSGIDGCLSDILDILGADLGKKIKAEKLATASEKARQRISEFGEQHSKEEEDENDDQSSSSEGKSVNTKIKEYHDTGLHILAELSSITIEIFKKSAEFMLIQNFIDKDGDELGQIFQSITILICSEFESITTLLTDKLSQETSDEADSLITSLYLECSNSCSYIQDAFNLLQPVLKLKVLESNPTTMQPTATPLPTNQSD